MLKLTFIGAGCYGTAVANHFADRLKSEVFVWGRNPDIVDEINQKHTNNRYLGDHLLSEYLKATSNLKQALHQADILFMAVPAQQVREVTRQLKEFIVGDITLINLAKGLEIESLKRMSQVLTEELHNVSSCCEVMTLSGPSFAKDVIDPDKSVALTLGGRNRKLLKTTREILHSQSFRVFACRDLSGVELGGSLKNVYAIMAGIMQGAGEGSSYLGEYIPRALVEIDTIKRYFGARRDTSRAVSSLGDFIITCTDNSRNFRFGKAFANCYEQASPGEDVVELAFQAIGNRTVEGYYTLQGIHRFVTEKNMFAPIIRELYDILYAGDKTGKGPLDTISSFRKADSLRTWENLRTYSRLLSTFFPRLWYRRYDQSARTIIKEFFRNA